MAKNIIKKDNNNINKSKEIRRKNGKHLKLQL